MKKNELIVSLQKIISKYFKKINWVYAYIAFIHWYISFFTDRFVFYDKGSSIFIIGDFSVLIYKCVFFIILFIIWQLVGYVIKEYKKNENVRIFIKYSLIYFTIMMIFLLFTWPGVWVGDEFLTLYSVSSFCLDNTRGILLNYIYIYAIMLFPFPTGITIVQNIIISLTIGYIIFKSREYINNTKLVYFMYIPFLLSPVVYANLYLMSNTLYGYMCLLLIFKLISLFNNKTDVFKYKDIYILVFLITIIAMLRIEGVICFIIVPLIFCFGFNKHSNLKQKILLVLLVFFSFFSVYKIYKEVTDTTFSEQYEIKNTILHPLCNIYEKIDVHRQEEIYPAIDKVIDWNEYLETRNSEIYLRNFLPEEYSQLKKLYISLIFEYPYIFLKDRYDIFKKSSIFHSSQFIFDEDAFYDNNNFCLNVIQKKSFQPINSNLRRNTISYIELGSNYIPFRGTILYNKILMISLIFFYLILSFVFKRRILYFSFLFIILYTFIYFLIVPMEFWMYYFYLYLCTYVFTVLFLIKSMQKIMILKRFLLRKMIK